MTLKAPEPIGPAHDVSDFDCGKPVLDDWLKRSALKNELSDALRTYVVCEDGHVAAYYCLATGSVARREAPGPVRRNMPEPISVMVIGRLAVDRRFQGRGLGSGLLRDAVLRTLRAGEIAGLRAILVHALDDGAARFYRGHGFVPSPIDGLVLMLKLDAVRAAIAG